MRLLRSLKRSRLLEVVFVLILIALAFVLRSWNLDWDDRAHLHPDERHWANVTASIEAPGGIDAYFDTDTSRLNPRNYVSDWVYGNSPLFAGEAAASWLEDPGRASLVRFIDNDLFDIDLVDDEGNNRFDSGYQANLIGRLLSALVDALTVGAVYLVGRSVGGRAVGLTAAVLQTFTVLHIQYAHFFGSEPWVSLFVTLTVLGAIRLARGRGGWGTWLAAGLALGLAISAKLSGAPAIVAPLVALGILMGRDATEAIGRGWRRVRYRSEADVFGRGQLLRLWGHAERFIAMALVSVVTYRVLQPYDFESGLTLRMNDDFFNELDFLQDVNSGGNVIWNIQWVGRSALLYPLKQVFLHGMGPGLALAVLLGLGFAVHAMVRNREHHLAVPLALVATSVVLVSLQFYAIIRYLLPAYPVAVSLGGYGLVRLWRAAAPSFAGGGARAWRFGARAFVIGAIAVTAFWGAAFVNGVYNQDNPRLTASEWMVENLPESARVSAQIWDDALPVIPHSFELVTFDPFRPDSPEKVDELLAGLDRVEYVVESSNKNYDAIPRIGARYPVTTRYYEALFDGSLGFEQIARFRTTPELFGIAIDDSGAEEAFTLYDHPTVTIWQKTSAWSTDRAREVLGVDRAALTINLVPRDAGANALQLSGAQYETQQANGTYDDVFSEDGFVTNVPWLWWLLLLQVASFAALPLTTRLFSRLPDHGYGLSKVMGLLALGLPIWLLVSTGIVTFDRQVIWLWMIVLVAIGVVSAMWRWRAIVDAWQQNWHRWIAAEVVFLSVFMLVVALRYMNPDLWHPWRGGEKPMELAYLTAITRSTVLPPYDPWFAGGYLNYYYFGWFLLAVPIKALGMPPDLAFNLGVATFAALAAVVVFTTVSNMAAWARTQRSRAGNPITAGLLGVLFFLVVGNFDAVRQIVVKFRSINSWTFGDGVAVIDPVVETLGGMWNWMVGTPLPPFDWWAPSRVNEGALDVTEFPAWSVLFGDLHPHFMGMAFFGLVLVSAFTLVIAIQTGDRRRSWALAATIGALTGVVRMVHTWDLPVVVLIGVGAAAIGWLRAPYPTRSRVLGVVGQLAVMGFAHLVVTGPYRADSETFDAGFVRSEPNIPTSNLDDFVAHWALFLVIAAAYFFVRVRQLRNSDISESSRSIGRVAIEALARSWWRLALVAGLGLFVVLHVLIGSVAAWCAAAAVGFWWLVHRERFADRAAFAHLAVAAFFALGFSVLGGVEIFRFEQDIDRLNTVFKFWLQVWHLFAVAAAFAAWWLLRSATWAIEERREKYRFAVGPGIGRAVLRVSLAMLIICGLVFPIFAPRARLADRFDTTTAFSLEGYRWLTPGRELSVLDPGEIDHRIDPADDAAMIDWLRSEVSGSPTVVEAVGGREYQWHSRVTVMTGLPAVLGWRWHQEQQRTGYAAQVNQRKADITRFFTDADPEWAQQFLRTYDVTFVIVGSVERAQSTPEALRMFERAPFLDVAFDDGQATVYRVASSPPVAGEVAASSVGG